MGHSPVPRLTVWRSSAPDGKDPGSQVFWCWPLPTSLACPPHPLPPQAPGETPSRCSSQTHPGWCCTPCPFFFLPSSSFASFLPSLHNSAFGSLQEIEMPLERASRKWKCIDSQSWRALCRCSDSTGPDLSYLVALLSFPGSFILRPPKWQRWLVTSSGLKCKQRCISIGMPHKALGRGFVGCFDSYDWPSVVVGGDGLGWGRWLGQDGESLTLLDWEWKGLVYWSRIGCSYKRKVCKRWVAGAEGSSTLPDYSCYLGGCVLPTCLTALCTRGGIFAHAPVSATTLWAAWGQVGVAFSTDSLLPDPKPAPHGGSVPVSPLTSKLSSCTSRAPLRSLESDGRTGVMALGNANGSGCGPLPSIAVQILLVLWSVKIHHWGHSIVGWDVLSQTGYLENLRFLWGCCPARMRMSGTVSQELVLSLLGRNPCSCQHLCPQERGWPWNCSFLVEHLSLSSSVPQAPTFC